MTLSPPSLAIIGIPSYDYYDFRRNKEEEHIDLSTVFLAIRKCSPRTLAGAAPAGLEQELKCPGVNPHKNAMVTYSAWRRSPKGRSE
jgi:hypothetical protein